MTRHAWVLPGVLVLAGAGLIAGCSQVAATSDRFIGAPIYPATLPANVQVLRQFPTRPYQRIGDVFIEPQSGNPPDSKIEMALQQEAARMGADAVVITFDRITRAGATISGPVGAGQIQPQYGHAVRAVAIKYQAEAPASQ